MDWLKNVGGAALGVVGGLGPFMLLNREWTLTLENLSEYTLIPCGTSETSGGLVTPLGTEIKPQGSEKFFWKKTKGSECGAVGAIYFNIGQTDQYLSVFGCIPMNMMYFKSGCNLYIGPLKPSAADMEDGQNGCLKMVEAGQVGMQHGCTYSITNNAEADFSVKFAWKQ